MTRAALASALVMVLLAACGGGEPEEPPEQGTASGTIPPGETEPGPAADGAALALMTQANAAVDSVRSVTYSFEFYGTGELEGAIPFQRGTVSALRLPGEGRAAVRVTVVPVDTAGVEGPSMTACTDGDSVWLSLEGTRELRYGHSMDGADDLLMAVSDGLMHEYVLPSPFTDELSLPLSYEGTDTVSGVPCEVVLAEYQPGVSARWWIGSADLLPRKVERIVERVGGSGVLALSELETGVGLSPEDFVMELPEGYEAIPYTAFLPEGEAAPGWELPTLEGDTLSLADLSGSLVVLDFWATWCGPCAAVMPTLQELHETYGDSGLTVVGVNTWESGDPAAFMEEHGYDYTVVLEGDPVAEDYMVTGIPTLYLIGRDGTVLFSARGSEPANEEALWEAIEEALGV